VALEPCAASASFHQTVAAKKSRRNVLLGTILIINSPFNCQYRRDRRIQPMSKNSTRGDIVGGRGASMFGARRGQSVWDTWNEAEGSDELAVAMNLLAVVRRDRAFSREVVRAFGMARADQRRTPSRGTALRRGTVRRARGQ
jgi:hypothetical protein